MFTVNKPNIIKKSKYQQCFYCLIVCKLISYAFWFSYQQNILTVLISAAVRGAALIRGRNLSQYQYPKVWRLFEARRLLERMRQLGTKLNNIKISVKRSHQHNFVYYATCPEPGCVDDDDCETISRLNERVIHHNGRY